MLLKNSLSLRSKHIYQIILGLFFSFIFSFSFFLLAVPNLKEKIIEKDEFHILKSRIFSKNISFTQKSDFVLKLKYDYRDTDGEVVSLNGEKLELRVSNRAEHIITRYYFVPYEIVREGNNFLKIEFFPQAPPNLNLRLRNYLGATENKEIVLYLRHSLIIGEEWDVLVFLSILFFIFSFFLWQVTLRIAINWFGLSSSQAYFNNLVIFLPLSLFYFLVGVSSLVNPFRIVVAPSYLFIFLFFTVLLGEMFLLFLSLIILAEKKERAEEKVVYKNLPPWLKKSLFWLKTREFSDKCVLFFIFLLIMCAFLLILKLEWLAEQLANLAYFALVIGVVIKFVKFVREENTKTHNSNNTNNFWR